MQQDSAPLLAELESCQERLRHVQAACGSKDTALRELRERQQGAAQERQQAAAALQQLGQQLADRDAQVAQLHAELQSVHQELASASAGLQAAAASHSANAEGAAARLEQAGQCTHQLTQAVALLLETLVQLGSAVAAAADQQTAAASSADADADALATAADLAGLVGLAPDDIRSVLLPDAGHPPAGSAARDLEAAAQQARVLLGQLGAGEWRPDTGASLLAAVGALREQCGRAQAALASSAAQPLPGAHFAATDLERRLAAAAAEVAELEARLG